MRAIVFEGDTWEAYEALRTRDQLLHRNLRRILKELQRGDPRVGTGKPEALKHDLAGLWSRRLSHRDRLIYRFDDSSIHIFAIGGHYEDH
ncbi:MAG: Txe/YoeB family addiction module toxin [Candidatus Contendobacter sp.]|nr:MAG: Txe/YoeB family addiction module toxin [Candidatus Contendobacter sp.]